MFKVLRTLLLLLAVSLTLQGCLLSSTPFKEAQIQSDKALVYIYRPESMISRGTQFSIIINGSQEITPLVNNGYVPVYVTPGNVSMVLYENTFPKGKLDEVTFNNFKAGGTYYVKANPALFGAYTLGQVDEATGQAELQTSQFFYEK